jgi:hypothetical protein
LGETDPNPANKGTASNNNAIRAWRFGDCFKVPAVSECGGKMSAIIYWMVTGIVDPLRSAATACAARAKP